MAARRRQRRRLQYCASNNGAGSGTADGDGLGSLPEAERAYCETIFPQLHSRQFFFDIVFQDPVRPNHGMRIEQNH
jgi:hypothetical protein